MARTKGSIGFKTKQKYLHDKFPEQGWMEETNKKVINDHYKSVTTGEASASMEYRESAEVFKY